MSANHSHPPDLKPTSIEVVEDAGTRALAEALKSSFVIVKILMFFLILYFCGSNFFTVSQSQRAIVLRFGKPVGVGEAALRMPGFHLAWPYPIDEVVKIPSAQILSADSTGGWWHVNPRQAADAFTPTLNPVMDGYALTGDGNIIHIRATLRYRVTDPIKYYFNYTSSGQMVTNALNNALFYATASFTVDDALRLNLARLQERVILRIEQLMNEQELGIAVQQLDLVTSAPRQVKDAFEAVTAAENDRSKTINEAQGYANETLARAKGEATARINAGETDRTRLVEEINAEASYFSSLLPKYEQDPLLFKRRLQIEHLGRIMADPKQEKFFIPARGDGQPRELRVLLNKAPVKSKPQVETPKTEPGH